MIVVAAGVNLRANLYPVDPNAVFPTSTPPRRLRPITPVGNLGRPSIAYTCTRPIHPDARSGGKVYEIRVRDDRINAYRVIKGENRYDVEAKAAALRATWDDRW